MGHNAVSNTESNGFFNVANGKVNWLQSRHDGLSLLAETDIDQHFFFFFSGKSSLK
jgi:hypothetical protein